MKKPDMFNIGEAETRSAHQFTVSGYASHLYKSKLNIEGIFRRDIAIFHRTEYRSLSQKYFPSSNTILCECVLKLPHSIYYFDSFTSLDRTRTFYKNKFLRKKSYSYYKFSSQGNV